MTAQLSKEDAFAPAEQVEAAEQHGVCANCDARLMGDYCYGCGQKAHPHTRLTHLIEEFAEGVAHFDGRMWRTLPLLVLRPGRLSREWREGKRARYVPPLHMFLFAVFALFLAISVRQSLTEKPAKTVVAEAQADAEPNRKAEELSEGPWLPRAFAQFREDPKYYGYKAESLTYKLAPLFALLSVVGLWLLLAFKKGLNLYDHSVVALYGLAFLAVALLVTIGLAPVLPWNLGPAFLIATFLHAIVHLRGAYRLSWAGAVLRTFLLGLVNIIIGLLFALLVIGLSTS